MTPTPDTTPAAVEAMIERLLAGDLCTVELAPEAAAMLREVARERDRLNVWCSKEYSEGAKDAGHE